jgi:hypothetical protein
MVLSATAAVPVLPSGGAQVNQKFDPPEPASKLKVVFFNNETR